MLHFQAQLLLAHLGLAYKIVVMNHLVPCGPQMKTMFPQGRQGATCPAFASVHQGLNFPVSNKVVLFSMPFEREVAVKHVSPTNSRLFGYKGMVAGRETIRTKLGAVKPRIQATDQDTRQVVISGIRVVDLPELREQCRTPFLSGGEGALDDVISVLQFSAVKTVFSG